MNPQARTRTHRRAKRVDEPAREDEDARDLETALKMPSEELYSKPTHFILEMIQNADDNQYSEHEKESLAFLYRDNGYLWFGCNEQEFSPRRSTGLLVA